VRGAAGGVGAIRQGSLQADARHRPLAFRILTLPAHPLVGRLTLEPSVPRMAQAPDLWMLVYTPAPGTDTGATLQRLMSAAPQSSTETRERVQA